MLQLNIGSQLPLDPMVTNMAMNYGADIMEKKKKEVEGMMEKYVSIGQLKVYMPAPLKLHLTDCVAVLFCRG